jgi:hypothetical protein
MNADRIYINANSDSDPGLAFTAKAKLYISSFLFSFTGTILRKKTKEKLFFREGM